MALPIEVGSARYRNIFNHVGAKVSYLDDHQDTMIKDIPFSKIAHIVIIHTSKLLFGRHSQAPI